MTGTSSSPRTGFNLAPMPLFLSIFPSNHITMAARLTLSDLEPFIVRLRPPDPRRQDHPRWSPLDQRRQDSEKSSSKTIPSMGNYSQRTRVLERAQILEHYLIYILREGFLNPSNAEATFVQNTRTQIFLNMI